MKKNLKTTENPVMQVSVWNPVHKTRVYKGRWYKLKFELYKKTCDSPVLVLNVENDIIRFFIPEHPSLGYDVTETYDLEEFVEAITFVGPDVDLTVPK